MATTFYPIYFRLNELSDERLCIGLLALSADKVLFDYSKIKLKTIEKHYHKAAFEMVGLHLETLKTNLPGEQRAGLFYNSSSLPATMTYLINTSHGLIAFGEALVSAAILSPAVFKSYFADFVGSDPKKSVPKAKDKLKEWLAKPGFDKGDKNLAIKPNWVNHFILNPHQVSFAAKNGTVLLAEFLDLSGDMGSIENRVYHYHRIVEGFKSKDSEMFRKGKYRLYHYTGEKKSDPGLVQWLERIGHGIFEVCNESQIEELHRDVDETHYEKLSLHLQ